MVKLGTKVRDKISGFEGIVTGYVRYLSGCNQALLVPRVAPDGTFREALWFDEQRLEPVVGSDAVELENHDRPGSDRPAPVRYGDNLVPTPASEKWQIKIPVSAGRTVALSISVAARSLDPDSRPFLDEEYEMLIETLRLWRPMLVKPRIQIVTSDRPIE